MILEFKTRLPTAADVKDDWPLTLETPGQVGRLLVGKSETFVTYFSSFIPLKAVANHILMSPTAACPVGYILQLITHP